MTSLTWYQLLNSTGTRYMFLNDVTWCPGTCSGPPGSHTSSRCPQSYSQEFVEQELELLAPRVAALREAGLLEWAYIYGGDECPSENRSGVMQMFEAVKSRWPELRTKTSLQWAPDDPSLPVDTWAQTYMDYYCEGGDWDWRRWKGSGKCERTCTCNSTEASRAKREAWQAAGKKYDVATLLPRLCHTLRHLSHPCVVKCLAGARYWWYWACQPTEPWLNPSFVEWPAIHARLFFWLMALENVTGTQ